VTMPDTVQESIRDSLRATLLEGRPVPIKKAYLKRLARSLFDEMYKRWLKPFHLKKRDRPTSILFIGSKDGIPSHHTIEFTELAGPWKGRKRQVPIVFQLGGTGNFVRKYITGGGVYSVRQGKRSVSKYMIYLNIADTLILDFVKNKKQVIDEFYSVLIHEATHLADQLPRVASDADNEDLKIYYNKPTEVRAFMQQIVDEVVAHARSIAKDLEGFTDTEQLVRLSLERSTTWDRVRPYVNPSNKRKILKAVHGVIDRANLPARYE